MAAGNICGVDAVYDETTNPTCVYMEPEAASVGLTEEQCKARGLDYVVGTCPLSAHGQALNLDRGDGMVTITARKTYGEAMGMHGPRQASQRGSRGRAAFFSSSGKI